MTGIGERDGDLCGQGVAVTLLRLHEEEEEEEEEKHDAPFNGSHNDSSTGSFE